MACSNCNCTYSVVSGSEVNVQDIVVSSTGTSRYTVTDFTQPYSFTIKEVCKPEGQGVISQDIEVSGPAPSTCDSVNNCVDTAALASAVLALIPGTDSLVVNPDGTIVHTALNGAVVTVDLKRCQLNMIAPGQYSLTDDYGSTVTLASPTAITLVDNGDGTFTFSNGSDPDVTFDSKLCLVEDLGSNQYRITDDSGNVITFTAATTPPTVVDNLDGSYTYDNGVDTPVTWQTEKCTVVDNGGGSYTVTDDSGTSITFTVPPSAVPATLTDNLDDTWTFDNNVDTPVVIDIRKATIQNLGGSNYRITDDFGNSVDVSTGTETITTLGRTGDELTYANEDASNPNVDLSDFRVTVTDNLDGTYDLDDGVGNLGTIDTKSGTSADSGNLLSDGTDGLPFLGSAPTTVTEFTSSGNYTIPAFAKALTVKLIGGGGGGAGGHSNSTADYSDGGGGGGGGQYTFHTYSVAELGGAGTVIAVTIGAGGTGGSGGTYDGNDNQTAGGTGGTSTFGNYLIAIGGNGGTISNTLNTNVPVGGTGVSFIGYTSGNGGDAGCYQGSYQAATSGQSAAAAPGGGGGGAHGNTSSGGAGGVGFSTAYRTRTTTAGGTSGTNGTAAASTTHNGGGGGGSRTSTATGGDGGAGARGGGGGGGGGSITAIRAGNGGAGGAGYCVVYAY